jgi:hypothetical protein
VAGRQRLAIGTGVGLLLALWLLVGLGGLQGLDGPFIAWVPAHRIRGMSILAAYLLIAEMGLIAGVLVALFWRRWGLLCRLAALLVLVFMTIWVLKHAGETWPGWAASNFPSGHTSGGALLSLLLMAAVARIPLRAGPARALRVAGWAFVMLFGALALYPLGHGPAEVVGGYVLAAIAAVTARPWIAAAPPPRVPGFLALLAQDSLPPN